MVFGPSCRGGCWIKKDVPSIRLGVLSCDFGRDGRGSGESWEVVCGTEFTIIVMVEWKTRNFLD